MSDTPAANSRTVRHVLEDLLQTTVAEADIPPLADLANALLSDMRALRAVEVGDAEPASAFEASNP